MLNLSGKRYVVFGVANEQSICWGIVLVLLACGAEVILVCHPHRTIQKWVRSLAEMAGIEHLYLCDVGDDESIAACFANLAKHTPIDGVVHGIANSDKNELKGRFIHTSRKNFLHTLDISCFSLVDISARSLPLMPNGGSIVALTFTGVFPNYNVMGVAKGALKLAVEYLAFDLGQDRIRVNAISASPEETLSARGIDNYPLIGKFSEAMSPMGRRATIEEIGWAAAFLLSTFSSGTTGKVHFVDCGSSVSTMPPAHNAPLMAEDMVAISVAQGIPLKLIRE